MRNLTAIALLPALLVSGCITVGPKYKRPTFQPPAAFYSDQQASATSEADLAWWEIFKDPMLQGLIKEAFDKNYDLRLAVAPVEQQALLGVAHSPYYPQVGYGENISGHQSPVDPFVANHTYYAYSFTSFWEIGPDS